MVRPANFGFNAETAKNNSFQIRNAALTGEQVVQKAREEFDALVLKIQSVGIEVIVEEDTNEPLKRDAVFPNNWFSTHTNGNLITYPIYAPIRRLERREDIVARLEQRFNYTKRIRLEESEADNLFLEGTGSMIFDREHGCVFACRSIRTDESLLDKFCEFNTCKKVVFDAVDEQGMAIYHTNVMMAIGETFCVICLDSIVDLDQRKMVVQKLKDYDKDIVEISYAQMNSFAGNMLQLRGSEDKTYLAMSSQAYESLTPAQIKQIESHTNILHSPINTIETSGGGSVRCMIAEIFPPAKK